MKAVVLAAGKGTRMLPLTADRPKHMIPVNGVPFIDHIIGTLHGAGITEIAIVVSYMREILESHVKEKHPGIVFIGQAEPKGTGHAVLSAIDFVGDEEFVVMMGDNLYSPEDVRSIAGMEQSVVAGYEVPNPSAYGVLMTDGRQLISIIEKPSVAPSNLINTGLYKFTPEIFPALKNIGMSPRGEYELPDAINILARAGKVFVYKLKDYWLDFGKPEDVKKVEDFLNRK